MLLMFEKPSLRTRISFEVAMNQMGGNAIYYDLLGSPLNKGKETIEDTAKVISRYCDLLTARVYDHEELKKLASNSDIPVINALSNSNHPCQAIGDLITIKEKFKKLKGLTLAYYGDGDGNVTHSLMHACSKVGINIYIFCPKQFMPKDKFIKNSKKFAKKHNSKVVIENNPRKIKADIMYTDTWMSYHINQKEKSKRVKIFKKYQVNKNILGNALFMHCLPAQRNYEVSGEVMDGKKSIIFDQAENRLHSAKAIILWCLK
jgi:ornithine carbamoyltransferase